MKIAAIAKVIKDRGSCRLYRVHGSDDLETKFYIGTNSEIYSLEGFPKPWSEAEVMTMLGIEKKKWEDVIYTAYDCNNITDVCGLNLEDAVQNEVECKTSYINLNIGGALLMGLTDPDEKTIDFIAASRLVPVIFHISIDRRNIMQEEVDKLYKRYVLSAPLDYCMRIPYRAEQIWLAIRHALAWHDNPKGDYTVQYDKPLNRSDQPQPMVQLYEAPTEGKPTCDGKCAKCGRC